MLHFLHFSFLHSPITHPPVACCQLLQWYVRPVTKR